MKLELTRFSSDTQSTLGTLFDITNERRFLCFTLEDEHRDKKVKHETRIPSGTYVITFHPNSRFDKSYRGKFGKMHKGMLLLNDVPGFEGILIHMGNSAGHTSGCLLVGDSARQNITQSGKITDSKKAYKRIYPPIAEVLEYGEKVTIQVIDYDTPKT